MKPIQRKRHAAFTLIEMMAVITIIVILAGLVVGGLGFVTERQAKEKAKVQMSLLSKALEEYKLDNGTYPATEDSANGEGASAILFKALYWDGVSDPTKAAKIYVPELDPAVGKQGWTSGVASAATKISDPWGGEYRYRTATNAAGAANSYTQNPDFDLWSVGKDAATNPGTVSDKKNRDDIKSP
jgi:prepilin-type N-terminal cleavage/methylation domain-containing protein